MSRTWTPEMDAKLLKERAAKRPWKSVILSLGVGKTAAQRRYEFLIQAPERADTTPRLVREIRTPERDGLDWLRQKKRLNPRRFKAGLTYREWFRDAGGPAIKSGLNVVEGGPGLGMGLPLALEGMTDAKARLFRVRHVVLKGQPDMVLVLDAVCGTRQTLMSLANGNGHRANELEAVLMVALDLVAAHLEEGG